MLLRLRQYQRQIIIVIVLLALAGVLWTAGTGDKQGQGDGSKSGKTSSGSAMEEYSLDNGGYKYSLQFYKGSRSIVQDDGVQAIAKPKAAIVSVRPTNIPVLTDCKNAGEGWKQAGTVKIRSKDVPLCTLQNKGYATLIDDGEVRHLVTITYLRRQGGDILRDLQQIIGSISVTAPGDTELNDSPA